MKLNDISHNFLTKKNLSFPDIDVIDICIFSLENFSLLEDYKNVLSEYEHKRKDSFRFEPDRKRFIASRMILRKILGLYLDYPARNLIFKTGSHGKPYLAPAGNDFPDIHFNLSHSGNLIAFAFSSSSPVGIDIEATRTGIRTETLVRRFFHPAEYSEFLKLSETAQRDFLFRRWTVREAFLKGLGTGLSTPPESFYIEESREAFYIKKSQKDYSSWHIKPFPVPDGYYCSVAYRIPEYANC